MSGLARRWSMASGDWVAKNIPRMMEKGDVKGLSGLLRSEHRAVRAAAARALDTTGWSPSDEVQRIHYLIAKEQWDELARAGSAALAPLASLLSRRRHEDVDVRRGAAWALGQIGDLKAVNALLDTYCLVYTDSGYYHDFDCYARLVPAVADALVRLGKGAVDRLCQALKRKSRFEEGGLRLVDGTAAVWALCEIGDRKAAEPVVDWMFKVGTSRFDFSSQGKPVCNADVFRAVVPPDVLPRLLGDYADLIWNIFAWRPTNDPEAWDVSRSNEAVRQLCMIKTPASSNILHKVTKMDRVGLSLTGGAGPPLISRYLDFESQRRAAKDELKRRGNPRHEPSVYLKGDDWRL
jgi:hypothetical protein